MCRLFPCIPILEEGGGGIKNGGMCNNLKKGIATSFSVFLKKKVCVIWGFWVTAKHTTHNQGTFSIF